MNINLSTKSDHELARLIHEIEEEIQNRAAGDPGVIFGNEYAKRACIVAAAGGHSIVFIGCRGVGKTMMRRFAARLGVKRTFEMLPCPCGLLGARRLCCECPTSKVRAHHDKLATLIADIWVEVIQPPEIEMKQKPESLPPFDYYMQQVLRIDPRPLACLDNEAATLLSHAVQELGLSTRERARSLHVASTIARLEAANCIKSQHIAEAVMYRRIKPKARI